MGMTREEKIEGLYSLKEYLVENPIELEIHKSLPITLIDYAIEALEQEPTTQERQAESDKFDAMFQDGYNNGYAQARFDYEHEISVLQNRCYALTKGTMCAFCEYECKYKAESEG